MASFALFRYPHSQHFTRLIQHEGSPLMLSSIGELAGKSGFVLAPFAVSDDTPIRVILPDEVVKEAINPISLVSPISSINPISSGYTRDFNAFHQQLVSGKFAKLVLSRQSSIGCEIADAEELFHQACTRYPRMMISFVHIEGEETWLAATPEILFLQNADGMCKTMALAGTMKYEVAPEWSEKNRMEQQLVADYIAENLSPFVCECRVTEPYSSRAGDLLHLRSDFTFRLLPSVTALSVIETLHPTPAVCGLPKQEAFDFILNTESHSRRYYSGFMGPFNLQDETHLYVSLRCMEILPHSVRLYAGGGILPESELESEWRETEVKMQTMRQLLASS